MLKKIFFSFILILGAATLHAQEALPTNLEVADSLPRQTFVVDEVAAIVGNSAILLSDIEMMAGRVMEQRKTQGTLSTRTEKEEAFELLLTQHLLSTRARMDSLDKEMNPIEPMVEKEVERMIERAGSVAELERRQGKPIYQIKADITLDVKQSQLAQMMERKIRGKAKVNHGEVRKFVKTIPMDSMDLIPAQYIYSQIVKAPEQTDERRYAIRERLLEFRKRILSKDISLGALARLYSADRGTGMRGGEMGPQPASTFVAPFTDAAKSLKPGEVSEIVETEFGYHLIELISYDPPTDKIHVRHILLKPEFTVEESNQVEAELDSLITEINASRITFELAALEYSTDSETRENGGKAYNKRGYAETGDIRAASSRFMPDELMPADYRKISQLRPGQISEPFKTMDNKGNEVYKIVRLDQIIAAHAANIDDDYDILESVALQVKEAQVIDEWITEMIGKTYIDIKPAYLTYNLDRKEWREAAERSAEKKNIKVTDRPRPVLQSSTAPQITAAQK